MHHHHLLLLFLLLSASLPPSHPRHIHDHTRTTTTNSPKTIIILAGQSNMSGRGGATNNTWDHYIPPQCQPNPSILRFSAALQWEEARDPLHQDIDTYAVCGVGPGMPFANGVLRERPGTVLGLVPCAVGGTRIDQWAKGTDLYEKMVSRAKAAAAGEGGGEIGAVLWYQGESDTVNRSDAVSYKGKMEKLVSDLRADLGSPDLLVIQVALASGQGSFLEQVREEQMAVKLPNFATVDAKGLKLSGDYVHLTTAGQVILGQKLADAYLQATHRYH